MAVPTKSKHRKKKQTAQVSDLDTKVKDIKVLDFSETKNALIPHSEKGPLKSALSAYYQQIAQTPLLSPAEERALAVQVFEGHDADAFKKLVQANLRFVVKIAFEYSRYGAQVLDLIQEGNMGLIKAVQDFNPYKDVRLTTYAVWWIRSYIQDYLLRNLSIVRIGTTATQKKLFYRLKREQLKFEREGISPQPKAIAMELGVNEEEVKMMQVRLGGKDLSLSSNPEEDPSSEMPRLNNRLADSSPLASSALEINEEAALFKTALAEFEDELEDERERQIFRERMLAEKPKTLLEIGQEHGFSKERARQLEERVVKKLKTFLAKFYPDISLN